jgi:uncharacterized protein (DUF1778 family)
MMKKRTGRLSLRMTPDFLDLCAKTAEQRGLTLTEFTQIAMAASLTRKPLQLSAEAEKWMSL